MSDLPLRRWFPSPYDLKRIVVFRALVLGDMLCLVPALRALRMALPHTHVTLVSLPWAAEFVARFEAYVDSFIEFPGYPGLPEREYDAAAFPSFLKAVQAGRFDLALQMHGSGSIVNDLVRSFEARYAAGFDPQESRHGEREAFLRYPEHEHEIWRHLRLAEFLGVPSRGDSLEFPITPADEAEFRELRREQSLSERPYICIHPGARYPSRRWPADRFAAVADDLARRGLGIVLTGAPSERALAAAVSQAMTQAHVNLAGRTSLGSLAVCLARSCLLLCNDTGVSHVAAALRVPSVVVVTGSDPRRWAPLDRQLHRIVLQPAACRPCEHRTCPIDFHCASSIAPAHVLDAAEVALGRSDGTNPVPESRSVLQRSLACAD